MDDLKRCRKCNEDKYLKDFYNQSASSDFKQSYCKECANKLTKARSKTPAAKLVRSEYITKYLKDLKAEVYAAYGNRCTCCGEETYEFLTIDHVLNDGAVDRKKFGANGRVFLNHIKRQNFPDRYTLLCMNCNWAKGQIGYCPNSKKLGEKSIGRFKKADNQ